MGTTRRLRGFCLTAIAALALTGAACGDDEADTSTSTTSTSTGATGLTGATGSTGSDGSDGSSVASVDSADSLIECLDGEGLEAADGGTVLGLEDFEVVDLALGDSDQAAVFVILDSPEEAKKDVEEIGTLAGVASPEARGNVVYGFDATTDETAADEATVDACLPAASGG